jgi:DNA helicase HerA-like ATPase
MTVIEIGITKTEATVLLPLSRANRHGLVTGSTGTGKTTTLQRLAEEFSRAGVPVFAADVKGDLSGIAALGSDSGPLAAKRVALGGQLTPERFPVAFWDLFGVAGLPIRTSVQDMGCELLARMLKLNDTQEGTLAIAFRKSDVEKSWMLTLDDLRWTLSDMLDNREDVCREYGNITAASINTIQRQLLALEAQGGDKLFGEPPFDILDFIRTDDAGRGVVNLLHADQLMEAPKLYATFLLWLLTELFRKLPEAGDVAKPKLVFFFDEAHLLFTDAPKELVQQIERLVRLVRSKGVGVFFVTQSPADVPDTVLAQLGSRIQHALRAYTPKDQRMVKAAAQAFRENREVDVKAEITKLGVGEALISVLDDDGIPTKVEKVMIIPPAAQVGPISSIERRALMDVSPMRKRYGSVLAEEEAIHSFMNRMRRQRGLPGVATAGGWSEGDFRKFLPDFSAMEPPVDPQRPGRAFYLRNAIMWGGALAGSVLFLRAMI